MWKINPKFLDKLQNKLKNLRKEIDNKDEIICKLSESLNNITNNLPLKDPTVALNKNNLVPESAPSSYNENILPFVETVLYNR